MAQPQPQCSVGGGPLTMVPGPEAGRPVSASTTPPGMLEPPRMLPNGIELSVHSCTRSMAREVKYVFPHLRIRGFASKCGGSSKGGQEQQQEQQQQQPAAGEAAAAAAAAVADKEQQQQHGEELLIVPTIQKSRVDTVRFGAEVEEEKDRCLEYFADFAKPLCVSLRAQGHWADYIDPCSGLPVLTPHCTRPYSEVAGFEHLLRYKTQNAGCCKILLHPRWGSSCYPATVFTTAPLSVLREAIRRHGAGEGGVGAGIMVGASD